MTKLVSLGSVETKEQMNEYIAAMEEHLWPETEDLHPAMPTTETISTVSAMQFRAESLFSEMIQGKITGYRVEMDRSVHPATFRITIW